MSCSASFPCDGSVPPPLGCWGGEAGAGAAPLGQQRGTARPVLTEWRSPIRTHRGSLAPAPKSVCAASRTTCSASEGWSERAMRSGRNARRLPQGGHPRGGHPQGGPSRGYVARWRGNCRGQATHARAGSLVRICNLGGRGFWIWPRGQPRSGEHIRRDHPHWCPLGQAERAAADVAFPRP